MIPAAFGYARPADLAEALELLALAEGEAKVLAGGHSLLPLMKLRLATPAQVIDIGALDELSYIREEADAIAIGGRTRHHDLAGSDLLADRLPLLAHAAAKVGDPQVRHRGTLGGSLAHGDPAGDLPAVALALGANLVIRSSRATRVVAVDDFFTGFLETDLAPDELLVEVRLPLNHGGWGFEKFTRRAQDWAIVGVAAVRRDEGTSVALVNMGLTPLHASATESALAAGASVGEAAELAAEGTAPVSDLNASEDYRRHLAKVLVRRALEQAGY